MLEVDNVSLSYGRKLVMKEASFSVAPSEIGCLLGPSGSGKTTLLRGIAGFHTPIDGSISWNGKVLSTPEFVIAPEQRRIGMVFQEFALFPHLTVAKNIAFGLRDLSRRDQIHRVGELLELFNLEGVGDRAPHSLSGGEQQRVALARALAPKPYLLLMDEPFSSLDVELRQVLVPEVREILKHENMSAILVTHDQHEAFALADRIGVIENGRIHQWDEPYGIYHRPATKFIAEFIGEGVMIDATTTDNGVIRCALGEYNLPKKKQLPAGRRIKILVRPDDILHDDASTFKGKILQRLFRGAHYLYRLELEDGTELFCYAESHHRHSLGEKIGLEANLEHLVIFDQEDSSTVDLHLTHPQTITNNRNGMRLNKSALSNH